MKRLILFTLAITALLYLSGCSNSGQSETKTHPDKPAQVDNSSDDKNAVNPQQDKKTGEKPLYNPDPTPIDSSNYSDTENSSLRFVVMADSRGLDKGINSEIVRKTMKKIKQLSPQPEFAVMPGDLVDGAKSYKGIKEQLEYFKSTVTEYYPIDFFYPGVGNHEVMYNSGGEKAFGEVFKEFKAVFLGEYGRTVYYFDCGNSRFFMLNTDYPGEIHMVSDKQLDWVKDNLDPSKKHTFFFMHEPPYPTGSGVGSSLDSKRFQRNKLWTLIDSSNNPMVFCGHEHYYTRRHIDSNFNESVRGIDFKFDKSVFQVTTGSFGAPLYSKYTSKRNVDVPPVSQYHFAVIDITPQGIAVTVYNLEGKIIDEFKTN